MARNRRNHRKAVPALAIVVDGETEEWYLQMLKRNERQIRITIKPELASKNTIPNQYKLVKKLLGQEYTKVFWIVDMDSVLKETREAAKGKKTALQQFIHYRTQLTSKFQNVVVIVNNPCLEYWFLLHFKKTHKKFQKCSAAEKELKKYLKDYQKTQKYFTKRDGDIYTMLRPHLKSAIDHSVALNYFDPHQPDKPMSEMELFFQSKEIKKYFNEQSEF